MSQGCGYILSLQLSSSVDSDGSYVQVLESYTNIGPILDMSIVDLDKQGRDVVRCLCSVDCCGQIFLNVCW